MRIIIVTHKLTRTDGQGRVNYELARHAAMSGHAVHLIAEEVAPELREMEGVDYTLASHGPLRIALLRNFWFGLHTGMILRKLRATGDVVLLNGAITLGSSDINAVHFVHHGWGASPFYEAGRGLRGLYQRFYTRLNIVLERLAFRASRYLVAVSSQVASELVGAGQPPEKIEVIANGVDTLEFAPGTVAHAAYGLPERSVVALFVGGLGTPRKNLDTVLRALVEVPDLHLAVVGAHEGTSYPRLAQQLGVDRRVHFLGFRRDVAAIMQASDFFVFPSRYEPFGLVVLEAMASGLPVVTCRTAGAAELVGEECGVVVAEPNDVGAVADAMRVVMADLATGRAMPAQARRVAEQHDWSRMAGDYLELCARVAGERGI